MWSPTHVQVTDGGPSLIIKDELTIKQEPVMPGQDDLGTPSSFLTSTHQPQVKTEAGTHHDSRPSDNGCIRGVVMKDELVMKEEPLTADGDVTLDAPQADPTSTSSRLASQQSHTSVIQSESDSSIPGEKPHTCDFCNYRTGHLRSLNAHMRIHAGEKPHACGICDYRTGQLSNLKSHIRTHTCEKPHACDICDYRTGRRSSLKAHVRTHTGEKTYSCNICDYRTGHPCDLKTHMMTHPDEKPHTCCICDYRTGRLRTLKTHMKTHTSEKVHTCDICDYRARDLGGLVKHLRTHTGDKPFACDICDYRTGELGNLKRHSSIHTGEKPFACGICDYRTGHFSTLKMHMMTHTGEKPHACDICDYRAVDVRNLRRHIRAHSGKKPHACDICDYRTAYLCHLKRHMRKHSGGPAVIIKDEMIKKEHDIINDDPYVDPTPSSSSTFQTHQLEVNDVADVLHDDGPVVTIKQERIIKEETVMTDEDMITDEHQDAAVTASTSLTSTHQPEVKTEAVILHDGGTAVVMEDGVIIKEEAIMTDDDVITGGPYNDLDTPSSCLPSHTTHLPEVKDEADVIHDGRPLENSYIGDVIMKYELVMEEPMSADRDMTHDGSQADPTGTSSRLISSRSLLSAIQAESDSSVRGEKPYICDICAYRAGQLSKLKRHMRTHTGEKPHACYICDYKAGRISHLNTHMMTHTGEKPHACDICDYRTRHLHNLKSHKRTHAHENASQLITRQLIQLKNHMSVHTGEKPHGCDICGYRAGHLSRLERHMRTHVVRRNMGRQGRFS